MAKKFDIPMDKNIVKVLLEEAMPDNFLPYAVEVAKDRALPDVRDGLKPVHRRILYGAYMLKAYSDKPYYKSARIVGDILGKYHPHGDSSVYDAMVILAQNFSTRMPLIDGHGNWGSVDGDRSAAMRYTEARLSPIALEMLKDIDKNVVDMMDNYSDSEIEPTVLPARYPNLLVNGTFGIAVGLATNIPPHNLGETIDGVLALAENKDITTKELMNYIKGPDLPTGGILIGEKAIESAYETGEGRVTLRSKTVIEKLENDRYGIIITEFPYRKNKAKILQTISSMTGDKKHAKVLECISDIRDESDRNGTRAVIEFKKYADKDIVDKIQKYLFQKTELQCNLSFNMVALVNGKPETLSLKAILENYLEHQKDVVTRRTKRELEIATRRFHIIEGFIKAIAIMDEVIKLIRTSKSKKQAQDNLIKEFDFTDIQAEAILELMLYRLTGLEVEVFEKEYKELEKLIIKLTKILSSEKELLKLIKKEILEVKHRYNNDRRTELIHNDNEAKIDVEELIIDEDIMVTMSKEGFIKRISLKSYNRSATNIKDIDYREGDFNRFLIESNTRDSLMFMTNLGNAFMCRGIDLLESKWKEKGERLDCIIKGLDLSKEEIIYIQSMNNFLENKEFILGTNKGAIKRINYNRFVKGVKFNLLKTREGEEVISVNICNSNRNSLFIKVETKEGLSFIIDYQRELYKDKGITPVDFLDICSKDTVTSMTIVENFEYKVFSISISSKGIFKNSLGRNSELGTVTSTDSNILIFTEKGKFYNIPAMILQNIKEDGISYLSVIDYVNESDKIVKLLSYSKDANNSDESVIICTEKGIIKKVFLEEFKIKPLKNGELKLKDYDKLKYIHSYTKECSELIMATKRAMVIRFEIDSLNCLKKNALGIIGISLREEDEVIFTSLLGDENANKCLRVISKNNKELVIPINNVMTQNRAGKGKNLISIDSTDYIKDIKLK
ncbi:MAG: DNA topoisomerase (ATP-hydrolyzing) [Clostridium sp.]